jgi:asparagine synthase (glutamine-hydrolysing)
VSLETRLPLLDHRVIEAAARVQERDRYQPLGRKSVLRAIAATRIDPSIFERRKSGFVLPLELWTRQELGGEVERVILDQSLCAACGLDPATVQRLWRAFSAHAPGLYWSRVWALFTLLWWAREYRVSL